MTKVKRKQYTPPTAERRKGNKEAASKSRLKRNNAADAMSAVIASVQSELRGVNHDMSGDDVRRMLARIKGKIDCFNPKGAGEGSVPAPTGIGATALQRGGGAATPPQDDAFHLEPTGFFGFGGAEGSSVDDTAVEGAAPAPTDSDAIGDAVVGALQLGPVGGASTPPALQPPALPHHPVVCASTMGDDAFPISVADMLMGLSAQTQTGCGSYDAMPHVVPWDSFWGMQLPP
jgi:hypothetical protein